MWVLGFVAASWEQEDLGCCVVGKCVIWDKIGMVEEQKREGWVSEVL